MREREREEGSKSREKHLSYAKNVFPRNFSILRNKTDKKTVLVNVNTDVLHVISSHTNNIVIWYLIFAGQVLVELLDDLFS